MVQAAIVPPGEGEVLNIVGDTVRLLADSERTGGACVIFENTSPPGNGPPLHRHTREDEYFFVVEGSVKFSVNGRESILGPGGFACAPRGTVHAFKNVGAGSCRMVVICTPGGLEHPFRAVNRLHLQGGISVEQLAKSFAAIDLEILGPPLP